MRRHPLSPHGRPASLLVRAAGLLLLGAAPGGRAVDAGAEPPLVREIRVPFDAIPVLFEKESDRVLLPRSQFEDLQARARQREAAAPPVAALPTGARYRLAVEADRVAITGQIRISVLAEGLQQVPLLFSGVGLRNALLDDRPAPLGRLDDGRLAVFVEGRADHVLDIDATAPLQTTAAQQVLDIALPLPPGTRITLTAPGDVELRSGAAVAARTWDEKAGETRFELVPGGDRLCLVLTLNSRLKRKDRVVVARSVLIAEVTEACERLHATVSLDVLHGAVDEFRFQLPEGFEVTDVQSPLLSRWAVAAGAAGPRVDVSLREEALGVVVLELTALRTRPDLGAWRFPRLEPLDVAGSVAVVGVLLENRLRLEMVESGNLVPIDGSVLLKALPASLQAEEPGRPALRAAAAYYAPASDFALGARFTVPPPGLRVTTNLLLTVRESGLTLRGGFALLAENEKLFHIDVDVPAGWDVVSAGDAAGRPLAVERHDLDGQTGRLRVALPGGLAPGVQQNVVIEAVCCPPGWLETWSAQTIPFPVFRVRNATRDTGALAAGAADDLRLRPETLLGLTPLNANEKGQYGLGGVDAALAYRYDSHPCAATLAVERVMPRATAETFSFFRVEQDALVCHAEIAYDIAEARTSRLELVLPASTPVALGIRGLGDAAVKSFSSHETGADRRWVVELARPAAGACRLAVDFQVPLAEGEEAFPLPIVRAGGVAYQSGFLAVEGHPELEVRVGQAPRKVDIGELVEAEYQPGARLLGAYGFLGEPPAVTLTVARPLGCPLPAAIIQRAQVASVLSAEGVVQSRAEYHLCTKALYLEIELPSGSDLWSATLDGIPARPQQQGDRVLLDLPAGEAASSRVLALVYETPIAPLGALARTRLRAPRLLFRADDAGAAVEVPATDLLWEVYLPGGVSVLAASGTVVPGNLGRPELAAVGLLRGLCWLGGGIHIRRGLLGACLGTLGAARARLELIGAKAPADGVCLMQTQGPHRRAAAKPEPVAALPEGAMAAPRAAGDIPAGVADAVEAATEETELGPESKPGRAKQAPETPAPATGAVEGARSLTIDLTAEGESLVLRSLGERPEVRVLTAGRRRLASLCWAAAAAVFLGGVSLARRSARTRAAYVAGVLGAATVLPALPGGIGFAALFNAVFYAGAALVPCYLLFSLACRARSILAEDAGRRAAHRAPAAGLLLAAALLTPGRPARAADTVEARPWPGRPVVVQGVPLVEAVSIPEDALVVPYAPGQENLPGETVLVSRERFTALWQAAFPDPSRQAPPAPWALAGMTLRGTLSGGAVLTLEGWLDVDVFCEDYADISFSLDRAVLTRAVLDGRPARLRVVRPLGPEAAAAQAAAPPAEALPEALVSLPVQGRGRHRLEAALQIRLDRQGGWRVAAGRLPAVPAACLELTVPEAGTDVRLGGVPDRNAYDAVAAGTVLRTALPESGELRLQWRPRIAEGQVDQTLTVAAEAVFDILEDRLQTAWALNLAFRHGERDRFTVTLPAGYRPERVEGPNVRGWEIRDETGAPYLDVSLLKPARTSETLTVHAWRQEVVGAAGEAAVPAPVVQVVGAARQTGRVLIRHSPALAVRVVEQTGVRRVDIPAETVPSLREGPLGVRPLQACEFTQVPFTVAMAVQRALPDVTAQVQTILRVTERERLLESRLLLTVARRPLYRLSVDIPADLELDRVTAPGMFEWGAAAETGRQVLTVYLADGVQGEIAVVLSGRLGPVAPAQETALPRLWVLDIGRQEGYIAVQADPLHEAAPRGLVNLEPVPLRQVFGWLAESQRPLTQAAFRYTAPDHAGQVVLQPIAPGVRCHTVTNVRVTDRAIEETALLCFGVYKGGVQELRFRLPAALAEARITVPHLRQKTVEPVPDSQSVAVRLELQDQVSGEIRVLVEHDRLLTGQEHEVVLPVVETGRTDRQYLAVESAGRDEVLLEPGDTFQVLTPQEKEWAAVAAFFQGGSTQAFIARSGVAAPRLTFRTKERVTVETAGARIGLAETLMIVDDSGAYRAAQTYRIDNRTEQFLEVDLPAGAQLWTVWVREEPAKPALAEAGNPRRVRIPLVKTAAGDLDYTVVLKYAGRIRVPGPLAAADLPFVQAVNIHVEQSRVQLWLPATRRWFGFGGTLRRVREQGEFEAGYMEYQNRLAKRLLETLQWGNAFEKARAASNLRSVNVELFDTQELLAGDEELMRNEALQAQVQQSERLLREADEQLRQAEAEDRAAAATQDNRSRLNAAFQTQAAALARNRVTEAGANWDLGEVRKSGPAANAAAFRLEWFAGNRLAAEEDLESRAPAAPAGDEAAPVRQQTRPPAPAAAAAEIGQPAAVPEEPQAVQMDQVQTGKETRPHGGPPPAKGAPARRGVLGRAVQYQQRLAESKDKAAEEKRGQVPTLGLRMTPATPGAAGGVEGGMAGPGAMGDLTVLGRAAGAMAAGAGMPGLPPGSGMGGPMLPGYDTAAWGYAAAAGAGAAMDGLASLEVVFPGFDRTRWASYRFTTPRGAVQVTARAISVRAAQSLQRIGAAAAAVLIILALFRRRAPAFGPIPPRTAANALVLAGSGSLLAGVLPGLGLAAFLAGALWRLALAVRRRPAR